MPRFSRAASLVLTSLCLAGGGAGLWWMLTKGTDRDAGAGAGGKAKSRIPRAVPDTGRTGNPEAPGEWTPRAELTGEEMREILQQFAHYQEVLENFPTPEQMAEIRGCMDGVVARLGFTGRMQELMEAGGGSLSTAAVYDQFLAALGRGLRAPGGAALRSRMVDYTTHGKWVIPWLWWQDAAEGAAPGEYAALRAATREESAVLALDRGRDRARLRETPMEVIAHAAAEALQETPSPETSDGQETPARAKYPTQLTQSDSLSSTNRQPPSAWAHLRVLVERVPKGSDFAALDGLLLHALAPGASAPADAPGETARRQGLDEARAAGLARWVATDAEAAATYFTTLATRLDGPLAMVLTAGLETARPGSAVEWTRSLPPGPTRDDMSVGVAYLLSIDPQEAMALARAIGDPMKEKVALFVLTGRGIPLERAPAPEAR